jgi:hypothetical protein
LFLAKNGLHRQKNRPIGQDKKVISEYTGKQRGVRLGTGKKRLAFLHR